MPARSRATTGQTSPKGLGWALDASPANPPRRQPTPIVTRSVGGVGFRGRLRVLATRSGAMPARSRATTGRQVPRTWLGFGRVTGKPTPPTTHPNRHKKRRRGGFSGRLRVLATRSGAMPARSRATTGQPSPKDLAGLWTRHRQTHPADASTHQGPHTYVAKKKRATHMGSALHTTKGMWCLVFHIRHQVTKEVGLWVVHWYT